MCYYELVPHVHDIGMGDFIREYHLDGTINEKNYLGNYSDRERIITLPIIPSIEIGRNHKIPDLFKAGGGISPRFVISKRLKELLEKYEANKKIQFFPIKIVQQNSSFKDYFVTNFFGNDDSWIDFEKSEFIEQIITKEGNRFIRLTFKTENIEKRYRNLSEFLERADDLYNNDNKLFAKRVFISSSCSEDVLILDSCVSLNMIISDELKRTIEKQGFFGIEFKPLEISDKEWYGPNGLRKQFYK